MVSFLERHVKIATDPVFGNLCDAPSTHLTAKGSDGGRRSPHPRAKGSSFGTTFSDVKRKNQKGAQDCHSAVKACLFCKGGCTLSLIRNLIRRRFCFLKRIASIWSLCIGHTTQECRKCLLCKICDFRHASMLHIHQKEKKEVKLHNEADPVTIQTNGLTGSGEQDCKLVETYTFLDQGSSASFCTVGLVDKLNLAGRKTKILLHTKGQEKVVDSFIVPELEDSGIYCDIPDLFTQHRMPVDMGNTKLRPK